MRRLLLLLLLLPATARAVIVSGQVLSPQGRPVPGARIQLITLGRTTRSAADSVSGLDGAFQLRSDLAGRFLLLTTSSYFAPQISAPFYAGRTDLLTQNVTLDRISLTPQHSALSSASETPLSQLSTPIQQIQADNLQTQALLAPVLPSFLLQSGQQGSRATLYLRGANPDALAVLIDGIQAQPLGGTFDFAGISTTGLAFPTAATALELASSPNPLQLPAAEAGTLALHTAEAANPGPTLDYAGDAGNLHTWNDSLAVSLTHTRADLFAAISRFDTSNALPNDRFHNETAAANLGYFISANTSLRLTARDEYLAAPLPIPYDLGLQSLTRDAAQNLTGSATLDTHTASNWHNLLRYGLVRRREQIFDYSNPIARQVTLRTANGTTATGQPYLYPLAPREDQATNRDVFLYQTDFPAKPWFQPAFTATVEQEHALDQTQSLQSVRETLTRTNITLATSLGGELHHRLFYQASGALNHASLLGFTGAPRLGLTYNPVQPGTRRFRGTTLHLAATASSREPSLAEQAQHLFASPRARTFSLSADQVILRTVSLTAGYFHNQFSHQPEILNLINQAIDGDQQLGGTNAFRTQGFDLTVSYRPLPRLALRGGYTYLASLVEQTAALPTFNPNLPGQPIGATTALLGGRPFHRPPHTGFFSVSYIGKSLTANLQAALSSRSDDSTFTQGTPTFLLPNRNLDFGYTRLDAALTYAVSHRTTLYTELSNLLNDQHIGPIGYPSTPFQIRAGLRFRLGGN